MSGEAVTLERDQPGPRDDRPGLLLRSPFHADLVEDLKGLPIADRAWAPELDGWWVAAAHEDTVAGFCVAHFGGCTIMGGAEADILVDRGGRHEQGRLL